MPILQQWQLRVIVWKAKNIQNKKASELFQRQTEFQVRCKVNVTNNRTQIQDTDVHWGKLTKLQEAVWNWRMIFSINLQYFPFNGNINNAYGINDEHKDDCLEISLYNAKTIDSIGETTILLNDLLKHCYFECNKNDLKMITLKKDKKERFWVDLMTIADDGNDTDEEDEDDEDKEQHDSGSGSDSDSDVEVKTDGAQKEKNQRSNTKYADESKEMLEPKIEISIQLLTDNMIEKYAAGLGRGNPNANPYLTVPKRQIDACFVNFVVFLWCLFLKYFLL